MANDSELIKYQKEWHDWIQYQNTHFMKQAVEEGQDIDDILDLAYPDDQWTGLSLAAEKGAMLSLEMLKNLGAKRDLQDGFGYTALQRAAKAGQTDALRFMLGWRAKHDIVDKKGATALHLAVGAQSIQCVRHLLDAGADVNVRDAKGETCLHYAARGASVGIVELLMEKGASPSIENLDQKKPEQFARDPDVRAQLKGERQQNNGFGGMGGMISINIGGGAGYPNHGGSNIPGQRNAPQTSGAPFMQHSAPLASSSDYDWILPEHFEEILEEAKDDDENGELVTEGRLYWTYNERTFSCRAAVFEGDRLLVEDAQGQLSEMLDEISYDDFTSNGESMHFTPSGTNDEYLVGFEDDFEEPNIVGFDDFKPVSKNQSGTTNSSQQNSQFLTIDLDLDEENDLPKKNIDILLGEFSVTLPDGETLTCSASMDKEGKLTLNDDSDIFGEIADYEYEDFGVGSFIFTPNDMAPLKLRFRPFKFSFYIDGPLPEFNRNADLIDIDLIDSFISEAPTTTVDDLLTNEPKKEPEPEPVFVEMRSMSTPEASGRKSQYLLEKEEATEAGEMIAEGHLCIRNLPGISDTRLAAFVLTDGKMIIEDEKGIMGKVYELEDENLYGDDPDHGVTFELSGVANNLPVSVLTDEEAIIISPSRIESALRPSTGRRLGRA